MPVAIVNKVLGLELDPGDVWMSWTCHEHVRLDHPDAYAACYHQLSTIIGQPGFVGQSPDHNNEIEIIKRISVKKQGAIALAAVNMTPNKYGNYQIHSVYLLREDNLDMRRRTNRIVPIT